MLQTIDYDRAAAVAYARRWAYGRNPNYFDFTTFGGDCTNFASQCLFAGSGVMNYARQYGWYYRSSGDRTPSWTGVRQLYRFLTANKGAGPFATEVEIAQLEPGDLVQFVSMGRDYHHTPVVVRIDGVPSLDTIYVAAHTFDVDERPLSSYEVKKIRYLHIEGVRK